MRIILPAFLVFLFLASVGWQDVPAFGFQELNDIERQIWALEKTYVAAYKNAEHAEILALLHDQFLGWPDPEEKPTANNQVARFLQEKYAKPGTWSFEIDRAGIRVLGNVVITHYVINVSGNDVDGIVQKQATRITHTWIKEGSEWKILGGMSNVQ
jgi:ketosteroid isomerase-like protein